MEGEKKLAGDRNKISFVGKKGVKQLLKLDIIKTGFIIKLKKGKTPNFIYVSNSITSQSFHKVILCLSHQRLLSLSRKQLCFLSFLF